MEQRIKRRTTIILISMLVICASLVTGAIYLYNDIFPKAGPIRCPDIEQITSVTLGCNTPDGSISMAEQYYGDLLQYICSAEPTRKQAINDYPAGKIYYSADVHADDRTYRYFVYEEGEQVFIEVPYEGIYASEMELLDLVLQYFEEG